MLRAIRAMLHGPLPEKWAAVADAPNFWSKAPFILLLAALLVFGCFPSLLTNKIEPSVSEKVIAGSAVKSSLGHESGRDAFHRVPFLSGEVTDAVERVPTESRGGKRY